MHSPADFVGVIVAWTENALTGWLNEWQVWITAFVRMNVANLVVSRQADFRAKMVNADVRGDSQDIAAIANIAVVDAKIRPPKTRRSFMN